MARNSEPKMETLVEARVTAIAKAAAVWRTTARRIVRFPEPKAA